MTLRAAAFVLATGVAALTAPLGCRRAPPPAPPHIVLLTVDTLRADRIGAMGNAPRGGSPSPVADALAERGVLFTQCYAPRGQTHPSLASMLTGKFPITHGLRDNGMSLETEHVPFPVLLRQRGYRTAAFCSNLDRTRWPFWVRGFDVAEDGVEGMLQEEGGALGFRYHAVWDERTIDKALTWIETLEEPVSAPVFLWVHLYDVHQPYTPSDDALARFADPAYDGPFSHPRGEDPDAPHNAVAPHLSAWALGDRAYDDADLAQVDALYDAGILDVERRLQRVLDALDARGILDDALVCYSSDHGDELGRHDGYFGHGNSIYDAVLKIPMILAWPGRLPAGRRVDGLCQNLDVFATVLEAAGIEAPAGAESLSLLPAARGDADAALREHVFGEWEDLLYSVSDGTWKAIANPRGARPRKPPYKHRPGASFPYECFELYRVADDPEELVDVYGQHPEEWDRLRTALRRFLAQPGHRRPLALPDDADPALEALGYVGSTKTRRNVLTIDCGDDE